MFVSLFLLLRMFKFSVCFFGMTEIKYSIAKGHVSIIVPSVRQEETTNGLRPAAESIIIKEKTNGCKQVI